jgi:putative NADH-flavin reductase
MNQAAISPAIAGADAVLSALGPHGSGRTTISQDSARSIIEAMQKTGARRLLTVSGSVVTDAGEGPVMRYLLKPLTRRTFLRHVCADMRAAEDEIHASHLDWTILRPPRLTAKPAAGTYRTTIHRNVPRGYTISRADLAACMLTLLNDPATVHRHVPIAS